MVEEKRFAVLIDADNVSAKYIKYILDEVSNYGVSTYKRIYGDWTSPGTASWKEILLENSITPVQQYSYTVGKNATDSAMIIDAMDILYSANVEGFCIVSSDSDFTKLSSRLRESGMLVVGMGEKKTPKPFIAACNQFKYLDVLLESDEKNAHEDNSEKTVRQESKKGIPEAVPNGNGKKPVKTEKTDDQKSMTDIEVIKATVHKMMNEVEAQSMNMGEIGNRLVKRYPDFDVRNYGDTKLSKFLKKFDFLDFNTKGKDGTSMWVSLKGEGKEVIEEPVQPIQPQRRTYRRKAKKK
ncbi:NYN domain-containing protein [Proteiniclasticum sp.]|uniref:NYN domain-containing protein n=1 Tax=Proteiniclasticum sp. TaxID=2053595 RepID=UPI0028A067E7|nr:NYN domain-containing protein [Proteiniclasticum sp.]